MSENNKPTKVPVHVTWTCPNCRTRFRPSKAVKRRFHLSRHMCPNCVKQTGRQFAVPRRPKHQPNPKPQQQHSQPTDQSAKNMRTAMRSSARGTIIPSKNAMNAERFFVLQTLNPKATMGSRVVRLKSDDTQVPTVGYNFNSVFTVSPTQGNDDPTFKIMFLPSPLIIAQIFSTEPVIVSGHRSFSIRDESGITTYIVGSKVGQLGTLDADFNFVPKLDWSKYRCIGYSAGSQWVGREIDKSGVVYAARMNESTTPLSDFDPTAKQDSIFGRAFQEQTFSGMHKEPVYDWTYVDENDAAVDEPDIQPTSHTIKLKIGLGARPPVVQALPDPNPSVVEFTEGKWASFTAYFADIINGPTEANREYVNTQWQALDRQWKLSTPIGGNVSELTVPVTANITAYLLPRPNRPDARKQTLRPEYSINTTLRIPGGDFYAAITSIIGARLTNDFSAVFSLDDYYVCVGFEITGTATINRESIANHRRSEQYINLVGRTLLDDNAGLFVDDTWATPIAEYRFPRATVDQCIMLQFVHVTNYELMVADTSIISNFAVASRANNRNDIIDVKSERMQKIMQAIPPMITLDNGIIGQTAHTELSSRGIVGDIANLLGPLATLIFPEFKPMIGIAQSLANKFDSLNII